MAWKKKRSAGKNVCPYVSSKVKKQKVELDRKKHIPWTLLEKGVRNYISIIYPLTRSAHGRNETHVCKHKTNKRSSKNGGNEIMKKGKGKEFTVTVGVCVVATVTGKGNKSSRTAVEGQRCFYTVVRAHVIARSAPYCQQQARCAQKTHALEQYKYSPNMQSYLG